MDYGLQTFGRETGFEKYNIYPRLQKSLFDLFKGLT